MHVLDEHDFYLAADAQLRTASPDIVKNGEALRTTATDARQDDSGRELMILTGVWLSCRT